VNAPPLLEVEGLAKEFGGLSAVSGVDFTVKAHQIKALIGPNGAGKTTIFNLISGALRPTRGRVLFDGEPLPDRAHAVAARGIARTFQLVKLFGEMTVLDNVLVGCHRRGRTGWVGCALRTGAACAEERHLRACAGEVLGLVGLSHRAHVPAGALSYGDQRRLEIGRALASEPRLLLLDEPGAGLDHAEHAHLGALISRIRDDGTTVLLVDHHMDFVMDISDEVLVLSYGRKLAEGPPDAIRANPDVIAAYLGEEPS
jgi:ABC-type branched-subunit amino acid transport system ATPase component